VIGLAVPCAAGVGLCARGALRGASALPQNTDLIVLRQGCPMKLIDAARVIRSKNAGPTQVTLDLMFDSREMYERALAAPSLKAVVIAQRFNVAEAEIIPYPAANAIKIVLPRRIIAGTPGDTDVYGAQQHRPILDVEI
jgi:hypothetical protein